MKFTPKELEENVNVSKSSSIKDFFVLLFGTLAILIAIYIILGMLVGTVVTKLPEGLESKIGKVFTADLEKSERTDDELALQKLLDEMLVYYPHENVEYKVHIKPASVTNAYVLPGGHIAVLSPLLREVESENELAFILAHEVGHHANRDHLRAFGRKIVLLALAYVVLGNNSDITQALTSSLENVEMRFSQKQEIAADLFAIELINQYYGHVGGVFDFFDRVAEYDETKKKNYFFASHPHPHKRNEIMKKYITENGLKLGEKSPFKLID
jgi:predicted Zn-dependent protease